MGDKGSGLSGSGCILYRLLERSWLYRLSQVLLAPGAEKDITKKINSLLTQLPSARRILDVGCGPSSWLWQVGLHPVGLDFSPAYAATFSRQGEPAVTGSAAELPFSDSSFDGVWSFWLLHHLPDGMARRAVSEMLRVCHPGGYVVVFDAVLPEPAWRRPVSWLVRMFDRGRNMRPQHALESLLLNSHGWACERVGYSHLGHEALVCLCLKK